MELQNSLIFKNITIIFLYFSYVQSARILFISSTPSPSHQKPFQQVWKALALRGHEMHVVTPNPLSNHTLPNLIQYNISDVYTWVEGINKRLAEKVKYTLEKPNFYNVLSKELVVPRGWHILNEYTLNHEEVKRLINNKPKLKFDAVIVEWLYPTLAGFGGYFEAPLIGICSLGAPTNGLDAIGNILNPVVTPDQNIPLRREKFSFRDRLLSALYAVWIRVLYHWYVLPWEDQVVKQHLGNDLPYLGDIERNISLLLLNRNQISHRVMSVVPGVVEYGGFKYDKDVQSLTPELKDFLDNSKNGVIYFSLGAAIKQAIFLSPEQIHIFKTVLGQLPFKILWKWENDTMEEKPGNVFISQWINQTSVLDGSVGTIYFSLGSSVKSVGLSEEIISLLQRVFKSLPYNVIWKWENEAMIGKPDNVYISDWIPQTAVLEHPNVKLFITQGGLQSTEEAIAAHKPIIGIPFHSDQTTNVDTCVKYGMGKMLDLEDLTEEKLRSYILEIVNNPSYAENAKKLDELMKDQPQDGLEKAIWWIEYVIRHKGAKHLRSIAVDLPFWKYLMLDVIGFILAILLSIILTFKLLIKLILGLFRKSKNVKPKTKRKDE